MRSYQVLVQTKRTATSGCYSRNLSSTRHRGSLRNTTSWLHSLRKSATCNMFYLFTSLKCTKKTHSKHVQNKAENCLIHNWMQWSTVKNTPAGFGRSVREFFTDQLTRGNPVLNERFFAGSLAIMGISMGISWGISEFYTHVVQRISEKPSPRSRYFYRYVDTIPSH